MNATSSIIESKVKDLFARQARVSQQSIEINKWATDYGIDSLGLLVLRENLERALATSFPDHAWLDFRSVGEVIAYIQQEQSREQNIVSNEASTAPIQTQTQPQSQTPGNASTSGRHLSPSGLFHSEIEVGMPLTGLINLAESPLLKLLGDERWSHLSALCGVPSRQVVDEEGARLYPTFFYVEMAFPEQRLLASFGENDRIKLVSTMTRFGASMLDGVSYLLPADSPEPKTAPFDGVASAVAAGVPAVRLSNIFVKQFGGAEWLKKSRPSNHGFERIPESAVAPDSYVAVKQAEKDGFFERPGQHYLPMTDGPVKVEYKLVADRDLNGAGLVYFANYPLFLDICEREALLNARLPLPHALLDRRTLVRRRSAYLNNASARDTLMIEIEPWVENPFATGHPAPEMAPVRLFVNYRMYRRSDERLMMVSTAEKILFGKAMEETPFFADLS